MLPAVGFRFLIRGGEVRIGVVRMAVPMIIVMMRILMVIRRFAVVAMVRMVRMIGAGMIRRIAAAGVGGGHAGHSEERGTAGHVTAGFLCFFAGELFLMRYRQPDADFIHYDHGTRQHGKGQDIPGRGDDGGGHYDDDHGPGAGAAHRR